MKKFSASEVEDLIRNAPSQRVHGEVAYAKEVNELKKGEGFKIPLQEWNRKTTVPGYFSSKFNKEGKRVVKTFKVGVDEYLVVKQL
jgi:hypothetical protein